MRFVKTARTKGVRVLCWTSLVASIVGGPLIAGMWAGEVVRTVGSALPSWVPPLVLVVLVVLLVRDLLVDGEPNHQAIWSLLFMPSVASTTFGRLGTEIKHWSTEALNVVADPLREWLGTGSSTVLALAVAAVAVLLAQRTVKQGKGKGAAVGVAA